MSEITRSQQPYEQQRTLGDELIRRQRELLHSFRTMLNVGRQDFERIRKDLVDQLEACEATRQKKRQEAEDEILLWLGRLYPTPRKESQEEKEKRERRFQDARKMILSRAQSSTNPLTARGVTDIARLRAEMDILSSSISKSISQLKWRNLLLQIAYLIAYLISIFLFLFLCLVASIVVIAKNDLFLGAGLILGMLLFAVLIRFLNKRAEKWGQEVIINILANATSRLSALYARWLELIDQEIEMQKAEIYRQHQQSAERIKQAFAANFRQQMESQAMEFTALSYQVMPPWDDPAWQSWQPGARTPGVVRLGTFIYPPKAK